MRSVAAEYEVRAPGSLGETLRVLAEEPGSYTLLAGGTEVMVALGAGRLAARRLLSLHRVRELRYVEVGERVVTIGAATTFTDLREHPVIAADFALLSQAAGWTGSVANQNRGTLGGNLVNASPAADSPPALLVYDAEVTLVSAAGERTLPYREFHLGYKKTVLRADELLLSVRIKRDYGGYVSSIRKVGAREAQAISKVAVASLARMEGERIGDIRIAAASLREVPARLAAAERVLLGERLMPYALEGLMARARAAVASEVRPIDDIRSTARYRGAVAANLVAAFVQRLAEGVG